MICKNCEIRPAVLGISTCECCLEIKRRSRKKISLERRKTKKCLKCSKPAGERAYCKECSVAKIESARRNGTKHKIDVFQHYGGCKCRCCGESRLNFLTLDHVNNDGADHRRRLYGSGSASVGVRFYRELKKAGLPPGFQVLCFNCNITKGLFGECPHETYRRENDIPSPLVQPMKV